MTSHARTDAAPIAPPAPSITFSPKIEVPPSQVQIVHPRSEPDLLALSTYASALPGVIVAGAGFVIVHKLTKLREREKRAIDICDELRAIAMEAATIATEAWLSDANPERTQLIHKTKQQIQTLGIGATRLKRVAAGVAPRYGLVDCWTNRTLKILWHRRPVDLSLAVAKFRKSVTADPFEDPLRTADAGAAANVQLALSNMVHGIDLALDLLS